jgi:hypothetical protein
MGLNKPTQNIRKSHLMAPGFVSLRRLDFPHAIYTDTDGVHPTATRYGTPLPKIQTLRVGGFAGKITNETLSSISSKKLTNDSVSGRRPMANQELFDETSRKQFDSEWNTALNAPIQVIHRYTGDKQKEYIHKRLGALGLSRHLRDVITPGPRDPIRGQVVYDLYTGRGPSIPTRRSRPAPVHGVGLD